MKSILRFDGPHTVSEQATTSSDSRNESQPASRPSTPPAEPSEANTRIDMAHDWPTTPHFRRRTPKRSRTNWTSVAGHVLAYSGVLALTLGALYIVVGYFGGPDYYAPRGWFITTTGQMLLFLGVITLVSSGMEQTADEVARRIDVLGEKILRIEQAAANPTFHRPPISSDSRNESSSERRTSRGSAEP